MSRNTRFQRVWAYLTELRGPRSWKQWIATCLVAAVVAVLVLMFWGVPKKQVAPVWGKCMHPTLKWISIPEPLAALSFSGWVHYRVNFKEKGKEPREGDMAYFSDPDRPKEKNLKRIQRVQVLPNGVRRYWMRPDNTGVTGDGSGEGRYDWVEEKYLIGIVDRIYTWEWLMRERTPGGRYLNRVRFSTPAQDVRLAQYVEITDHARREIARYSMDGEFMGWLEPTPMPAPTYKARTIAGVRLEVAPLSCASKGPAELQAAGDVRAWVVPGARILARYDSRFKPQERGKVVEMEVVSVSRISPYDAWPYGATRITYKPAVQAGFDPDWEFSIVK